MPVVISEELGVFVEFSAGSVEPTGQIVVAPSKVPVGCKGKRGNVA